MVTTNEGIDRDLLLDVFAAEADEILETMERSLVGLEAAPGDLEIVNAIFRAAHTLKGNAATVALDPIVELAHAVEELLDQLRTARLRVTPSLITLLLRCVDVLKSMIPAAIGEWPVQTDAGLIEALRAASRTGEYAERGGDESSACVAGNNHGDTLRVGVAKLDGMVNLVSELAIVRGRIRELTRRLSGAPQELTEMQDLLDRLCIALQDQVMSVRMVPIDSAFQPQVRVVRDLARAAGKTIRVRLEGGDVELDTTVVEQLRNPLTHIVRNAVDHGIESPERRSAVGKPAVGTIALSAFHEGGMVVVRVTDDGAGLDRLRIRDRARELGLIDAASELTEAEIFKLVLAPGFSTAGTVTEVSGRGVGMDVVHHNIAGLRGSVSIESRPGEGTSVTMRLPLTLAIIDALAVGVGDRKFVIPLDGVVECLDVSEERLEGRASGVIDVRGDAVPFVRLANCLGVPPGDSRRHNLLLIQNGVRQFGIVVDRLHNRMQAVIKPLRKPLPLPAFAATVFEEV